MKQILQNMASGETRLVDVPVPNYRETDVLIQSSCSLISIGTERMLVEFGKANMLSKAWQQPEKVKMVLEKVKTDGLVTTIDAVKSKLDQPLALGYCNVGTICDVGSAVQGFKVGDRVVSNGSHAEMVSVSQNLCARIPDNVCDETASFTVLGSIGLEGIRLAAPTLGESFVVTGLGLIGLLTVQLLRAHGCRVLGIDFDETKLELARQFGAETVSLAKGENSVEAGMAFSRGRGVDGVLITASSKSSDPVSQAARMCRKRGRIILIGVTGLELNRSDFYEKELSFQVSCSYGPGRYDSNYEDKGQDYPFGFVRWTEQRNFEAVLDMISEGKIDVEPLISHRFDFERALEAYKVMMDDPSSLGILLNYYRSVNREDEALMEKTVALSQPEIDERAPTADIVAGFVGAGNYATRVLIPAFKKTGIELKAVSSSGGMSCSYAGRKFGFKEATTDTEGLISDDQINMVVISTRHDSHVHLTVEALREGKHVWVEKPLAIDLDGLEKIRRAYEESRSSGALLMVGFNRRFAPQIQKVKSLLESVREQKSFIMTVNAGDIPADHWTQDPKLGGGRIIGEGCHFIDLLRFLVGHTIISTQVTNMGSAPGITNYGDKVSFILGFADGSMGTVHYLANGHRSFAKERLEIFCGGRILQLDNFRKLKGYGWSGFRKMNLMRQDKGQVTSVSAFVDAIKNGGPPPIPFEELDEVTRVSIEIAEKIKT